VPRPGSRCSLRKIWKIALSESRILIVEDDAEISAPLANLLRERGFQVAVSGSAETAWESLEQELFDLVLLDVMLPGQDGLELCRQLRARGGPRIIMLSAFSEAADKAIGLELGADDYIGKPFDLRELVARIRAVLRRNTVNPEEIVKASVETTFRFSDFNFYPSKRFVRSQLGLRIPLTGAETDLLLVFCQHPKKVLSREELIDLTRGEGFAITPRSIDLLVSRLRRKLAGDNPLANPICTIRADGYAFQLEVVTE